MNARTKERLRQASWVAAVVLALIAAARMVHVPSTRTALDLTEYDGGEMLLHALRVANGALGFRMPLYLILPTLVFDHWHVPVAAATLAGAAAASVLVLSACALIAPWGAPAALAAALLLLHQDIYLIGTIREIIYTLQILVVANLLIWRARDPSPMRSGVLAAGIGCSFLFRSSLAFFPPLLALFDFAAWGLRERRRWWKSAALLCVAPCLFLAPWTRANWRCNRRVALFEAGAADSNILVAAMGGVDSMDVDPQVLLGDRYAAYRRHGALYVALCEIAAHPARYAASCARRLGFILSLRPIFFLLALAALPLLKKRSELAALALLAGYFTLIHCPMAVSALYFIPLWPVLAVLAAAGAASLIDLRPSKLEWRAPLAPVFAGLAVMVAAAADAGWLVNAYAESPEAGSPQWRRALDEALVSNPTDAWLCYQRGLDAQRRGDQAQALADLGRAAALRPDPAYAARLAWTRMLGGNPAPLFSAHGDDPRSRLDLAVWRAHAYLKAGDLPAARGQLRGAWEDFNDWQGGWSSEGAVEKELVAAQKSDGGRFALYCLDLVSSRSLKEKAALLDAISSLPVNMDTARLEEAAILGRAGEGRRARKILAEVERSGAGSREARTRLIEVYRDVGERGAAARALEEALSRWPDDAVLAQLREAMSAEPPPSADRRLDEADRALKAGDRAAAARALAAAKGLARGGVSLRRYASLEAELGDAAESRRAYEELAQLAPNDVEARLDAAEAAVKAGRREESAKLLKGVDAARIPPGSLRRLGRLDVAAGDFGGGLKALQLLRRTSPNDVDLLLEIATAALRGKDKAAGVEALAAAKNLSKGPEALRRYAGLCAEFGEEDESLRAYELLEPMRPRDPELLRELALLHQRRREYADAARRWDSLTRLTPRAGAAWKDKGLCEYLMGAREAAVRDLKTALELEPGLFSAALTLGSIEEADHRYGDSVKVYEAVLAAKPAPGEENLRALVLKAKENAEAYSR